MSINFRNKVSESYVQMIHPNRKNYGALRKCWYDLSAQSTKNIKNNSTENNSSKYYYATWWLSQIHWPVVVGSLTRPVRIAQCGRQAAYIASSCRDAYDLRKKCTTESIWRYTTIWKSTRWFNEGILYLQTYSSSLQAPRMVIYFSCLITWAREFVGVNAALILWAFLGRVNESF